MNKCMRKCLRWISIMGSIILLAAITSFITIKKTVWITLKRKKENM